MAVRLFASLLMVGLAQSGFAQTGTNPLSLFKNYFVTGDYVVAGWVEGPPDSSGYAPGSISIPDTLQPLENGVPQSVPNGADIVAAYLYWATVEGSQSAFAGQHAFFNGYAITGEVLGNPNAPTSWSSGGCSGSSNGSKTMRTYRADVHPYLPVDVNPASPTFGALVASGSIPVRLADSGSNGNTVPAALGATLVIIYRVLSPAVPLNAIVLYDGAYAPSNAGTKMSQTMVGFYEPATSPVAKLTEIVANGQPNKGEQVYLNGTSQPLASLYGALPTFPGVYGTWDNPTWVLSESGYVKNTDTSETVSVVPTATNSGCVSWGAMILSTTVQDTDSDGLLDVWETNQGYYDVVRESDPPGGQNDPNSGQWVALPGADPNTKDLFVEVDYLTDLDGSPNQHSHLPKQPALDAVGAAFGNRGINVHFDLGPNVYEGDPYVINYSAASAPQSGTGGKAIPESELLCTDGTVLCPYPNQPALAWKGGLEFIQSPQNNPVFGNFQEGRIHSYHYVFLGHSLSAPESFWASVAAPINTGVINAGAGGSMQLPQLTSIVVTSGNQNNTTITIQQPQGLQVTPWDCTFAVPIPAVCGDNNGLNNTRISIAGALGQTALNGTYTFTIAQGNQTTDANNVTTTTFTITTTGVSAGTYTYAKEPQLGIAYLGPTSTSGHSDIGGGDSVITLGLWGADDPAGCQPDPTQPLSGAQVYCNNQVGTLNVQTGTLLHELGHSLTLTHGGTYYNDPNNPSLPSYELNCKPNFVSVMNYLFQVRGSVDGSFDYSGQIMPPLNETSSVVNEVPALSESLGIGNDTLTGSPAAHLTRWYSAPNALDVQLQNTAGGRYATAHCDGTPLLQNEPPAVRVDGTIASGGNFSAPLDWNNDLITPDAVLAPGEDLNHNGLIGDAPFSGFDDWQEINLQQMSARENAFGLSGASALKPTGGGLEPNSGGLDDDGGGMQPTAGNWEHNGGGLQHSGGGLQHSGGGVELDEDTAASTADPPSGLACSDCVDSTEYNKNIPLTWIHPGFGQVRAYDIWRAQGSFPTLSAVSANTNLFTHLATLLGTPPSTTFIDTSVSFNVYTYFVTETNKQGAQSGPSSPLVVTVAKASSDTTIVSATPDPAVIGQVVTVSFKVVPGSGGGVPTGSVTVNVNTGEMCGPVTLTSGAGSCSITFTTAGSRTLTASYSGDGNFNGSTSANVTQAVGDFSITATPPAQTIPSGHQAIYTVSVGPITGLTGSVALSCTGAPPNSTCAVSPSGVSLQGSPLQSTVTLSPYKSVDHGTFTLTISGTLAGGSLTHSTTVQLTVQ